MRHVSHGVAALVIVSSQAAGEVCGALPLPPRRRRRGLLPRQAAPPSQAAAARGAAAAW